MKNVLLNITWLLAAAAIVTGYPAKDKEEAPEPAGKDERAKRIYVYWSIALTLLLATGRVHRVRTFSQRCRRSGRGNRPPRGVLRAGLPLGAVRGREEGHTRGPGAYRAPGKQAPAGQAQRPGSHRLHGTGARFGRTGPATYA